MQWTHRRPLGAKTKPSPNLTSMVVDPSAAAKSSLDSPKSEHRLLVAAVGSNLNGCGSERGRRPLATKTKLLPDPTSTVVDPPSMPGCCRRTPAIGRFAVIAVTFSAW
ncbi:hypothetical protein E2562_001311 [Oryza meyeriana var. granulata]|uniref:Uncharacterized protein n=1 Tax=Oryza meyeriana var. granulata TaxID=110450 RepID=A0A6G1DBC6_9ORYZ|nr:hypothetical protein E2562_001311 [Oryza meyeriana var. granulata]